MSILLVGLDNPLSSDPRYALHPIPSTSTGGRIIAMINDVGKITTGEYHSIPKVNLFPVGPMPKIKGKAYATANASSMVASMNGSGRRVILLGNQVRDAFAFAATISDKPMIFEDTGGTNYAWIPHPSGRNLYYSNIRAKRKVGRFLVGVGIGELRP